MHSWREQMDKLRNTISAILIFCVVVSCLWQYDLCSLHVPYEVHMKPFIREYTFIIRKHLE
jgi:hypothetical protein